MNESKNFKVFQASAGSGKTYTIIKEYLKLCLKSENDIGNFRNILAITFTNASANDMKSKIMAELKKIIACEKVEDHSMASDLIKELPIGEAELKRHAQLLLTQIIHDYSSFCVSTIDAFVQKLARSFAHDLGLPSQYTVSIDEDDVADAIVANLGMEINDNNTFLVQILNAFVNGQFDKEQSTRLEDKLCLFVKKLMSEKAYMRNSSPNNHITCEEQFKQTSDFLKKKCEPFETLVKDFADRFNDLTATFGLSIDDFYYGKNGIYSFYKKLTNKTFEPIGSNALKVIDDPSKWPSTSAKKRLSATEIADIQEELEAFLPPFGTQYTQNLGAYLFYAQLRDQLFLYALRSLIKAEMEQLADHEEVVHISEFNKLISSVLGDFSVPFIYERIGERYKHVFIDEFQDTSVLQWQNLIPLIDNGLANGNMSMIVGDGKQSIYRFRSGEVEQIVKLPEIHALPQDERKAAFEQYQKTLCSNFNFKNLEDNHRSLGEIVHFNNDFFTNLLEYLDDDQKRVYIDCNNKYDKSVKIEQNVMKGEGGLVQIDLYEEDCPNDYYLERIYETILMLKNEKHYAYRDIAILTRKTNTGSLIANHLNEKGVPVISNESILLKSSDKIQLVLHTLNWFIDDTNSVTIAAILFFFHLTRDAGFQGDVDGYFDDAKDIRKGNKTLESVLNIEKDALRNILSKSTCLYDLCASLMRIYGFDSTQDAFLNYLLDEVFGWQSADKEGIKDFLDHWEKKKNKLAIKSNTQDAIQIMTIHKSKGLQFNVVIYPDAITNISERGGYGDPEIWISPEQLGFDTIPNLERVLFPLNKSCELKGATATQLYKSEEESNKLDNCNLLYVALTRPRQRMYILAKKSKEGKPNVFSDFLSKQENRIFPEESIKGTRTVYRFGNSDFDGSASIEETPDKNCDSHSCDWFAKTRIDPSPSMFWISTEDKLQPSEWGDLVHKILSGITTVADIDNALRPYLLDGTIDQETAEMLKARFIEIAQHATIKDAYGTQAQVKNECEILSHGEILRPDRYAELPDKIFLLDYKTGNKNEKHQTQLREYAAALQGMTEKPISAYLIYIGKDIEVVEVAMDRLF